MRLKYIFELHDDCFYSAKLHYDTTNVFMIIACECYTLKTLVSSLFNNNRNNNSIGDDIRDVLLYAIKYYFLDDLFRLGTLSIFIVKDSMLNASVFYVSVVNKKIIVVDDELNPVMTIELAPVSVNDICVKFVVCVKDSSSSVVTVDDVLVGLLSCVNVCMHFEKEIRQLEALMRC